jgi:hypothetical protein
MLSSQAQSLESQTSFIQVVRQFSTIIPSNVPFVTTAVGKPWEANEHLIRLQDGINQFNYTATDIQALFNHIRAAHDEQTRYSFIPMLSILKLISNEQNYNLLNEAISLLIDKTNDDKSHTVKRHAVETLAKIAVYYNDLNYIDANLMMTIRRLRGFIDEPSVGEMIDKNSTNYLLVASHQFYFEERVIFAINSLKRLSTRTIGDSNNTQIVVQFKDKVSNRLIDLVRDPRASVQEAAKQAIIEGLQSVCRLKNLIPGISQGGPTLFPQAAPSLK